MFTLITSHFYTYLSLWCIFLNSISYNDVDKMMIKRVSHDAHHHTEILFSSKLIWEVQKVRNQTALDLDYNTYTTNTTLPTLTTFNWKINLMNLYVDFFTCIQFFGFIFIFYWKFIYFGLKMYKIFQNIL